MHLRTLMCIYNTLLSLLGCRKEAWKVETPGTVAERTYAGNLCRKLMMWIKDMVDIGMDRGPWIDSNSLEKNCLLSSANYISNVTCRVSRPCVNGDRVSSVNIGQTESDTDG